MDKRNGWPEPVGPSSPRVCRWTRGTDGRSLSDLAPRVCVPTYCRASLGCHATTTRVRPFSGLIWATSSTPVRSYLSYLWSTEFKIATYLHKFFIFRRTVQIAPNLLHWNAHILLFWLNPTGHAKFHNTSDCLYSLLPASTGDFFFFFLPVPNRGTGEGLVPVPVTGVRYNSLLGMCTLNILTWPNYRNPAAVVTSRTTL